MRLLRKIRNSYTRSGILGMLASSARALVFYARELTPSRRQHRQRQQQREAEFDRRFGVKTAGDIHLVDVATLPARSRPFGLGYQGTSEAAFVEMLSVVPVDLRDFVFVDFGSGLGRVLLLASEYPFRSIRGVEFSPDLHKIACDNIRSYRSHTQKCTDIASICEDAAQYRIPEEQTILYFYNPFLAPVMERVVQNIEQSLLRTPREAYLIYYNPKERHTVDRSPAFSLIVDRPTYCVYRSMLDVLRFRTDERGKGFGTDATKGAFSQ
jgi:hypothetical protein